ncbi:MAG: signal recognition particle-docking protein FtsY [archaeon]
MFGFLKEKIKSFFKKEEEVVNNIIKTEELEEEKKDLKPKLTASTRIKKAILRKTKITDKDVEGLLEEFKISLLEADVAYEVAEKICEDLRKKLVGLEITAKDDIKEISEKAIKDSLFEILNDSKVDLKEIAKQKKPFTVLFLGPNGHGKTTTVVKVANYFLKNNMVPVIAAADTFRAASIEQLETLAKKIDVKTIKHKYGADPAAVCYDAISHAKANGLSVVLIDTAGRSELNRNLMEQLKKIQKVANPDFTIYVGESIAGNAILEEVKKFSEFIRIDGVIMTKADCDVKGGSILSVKSAIGKPILFLGVGQSLDDLIEFDPNWFIEKVL